MIFGDVAEALLGNGALERPVGLQLEAGGAADGVEIRGENGELDDLAVGAFHQDTVTALEVVLELAEGGLVPRRVEDEVSTTGLCGDDAAKFGGVVTFGNLDRCDHVVADDRRCVRIDDAATVIDHHQSAVDADW